jgi:ABC-2 type transport system permease protein
MTPIVKYELRRRKWSIFWWSLGVTALIGLTLAFYPTIKNQTDQLNKSFGDLSPQVTALFSDTGDFFSPVGYLSSQIFYLMLPMLLSILAIGLGSSLIARDETDHTLELTLARPVSRSRILVGKAVAGLIIVGIVGGVSLIVNVALAKLVNIDVGLGNIAFTSIMATVLAVIFGSVAFALTALGRFARLGSVGIAALVALLGYITTSFIGYVHWMVWPARLLPYHYYHPAEMLRGHLDWFVLACFIGVILVLGIIGAVGFRRRDIS